MICFHCKIKGKIYIVGLSEKSNWTGICIKRRKSWLEVRRIESHGDIRVQYSSNGGTEIVDQRGNLAEPEKYIDKEKFKQIIEYYDRRFNKPTSRNNKVQR